MNPNTDLNITAKAWADIVIENWLDRIVKLNIGYSFNLESALDFQINSNASGLPSSIIFSIPLYGRMVDMGVSRGVKLEDVKSGRSDFMAGEGGHRRVPKKWYSKNMYSQVLKLSSIMSTKYGLKATIALVEGIESRDF